MAKTSRAKAQYEVARRKALQDLAREFPKRYEELVADRLGRPLKKGGRPLTERVRRGEEPWGGP